MAARKKLNGLGLIRLSTRGPRDLVLDIADLTNDEVWDLDDILDDVGTVVGQAGTSVYVKTDRPAPDALRELARLARAKGIAVPGTAMNGLRGLGAGKLSPEAQACVSDEVSRHCRKRRGKCKTAKGRKQAVAIGYSVCRRRGFRSIPARP